MFTALVSGALPIQGTFVFDQPPQVVDTPKAFNEEGVLAAFDDCFVEMTVQLEQCRARNCPDITFNQPLLLIPAFKQC